ncbi:MAG: MFS transporter, partial [Chloroflexota bacterium]|nr:MFS transporter [Chloroflexota bacterium]
GGPHVPGRGAWLGIYRGAAAFCLVYFCYWSGVNAVMPLVSIYTRDILGATVGEAQLLPALLLLSTAALAIPMGLLGDRFGRRRVIGAGYAIVGICGLAGLVITTKEQGAIVFLLAGVGNAASMVLAIPLLGDLVPPQRVGAAAGILAASGSLAAPLASVVAGTLSDLYGPRVIFAMMAVMVALALTVLPLARPPAALAASRSDPAGPASGVSVTGEAESRPAGRAPA